MREFWGFVDQMAIFMGVISNIRTVGFGLGRFGHVSIFSAVSVTGCSRRVPVTFQLFDLRADTQRFGPV